MRPQTRSILGALAAAGVLGSVFLLYTRPEFWVPFVQQLVNQKLR